MFWPNELLNFSMWKIPASAGFSFIWKNNVYTHVSIYEADFKVIEETLAAIASDSGKARGLDQNQALALLEMVKHFNTVIEVPTFNK